MGEILLSADHLGVGVVSHECMHAALAWARRSKVDVNASLPAEERACYALTYFTRAVYRRVYAARLLVESQTMQPPKSKRAAA